MHVKPILAVLMDVAKAECESAYLTTVIARLWAIVSCSRYIGFYGEDHARLFRGQRRLEPEPANDSLSLKFHTYVMFGGPQRVKGELEQVFADRVVVRQDWTKFIHRLSREWIASSAMAFVVMMTNATFLNSPRDFVSPPAALVSLAISFASLTIGCGLLQNYSHSKDLDAPTIAQRLANMQHPEKGFAPISIALSVPRGLAYWSTLVTAAHLMLMAARIPWAAEKVVAIVILALVLCAAFRTAWVVRGTLNGHGPDVKEAPTAEVTAA